MSDTFAQLRETLRGRYDIERLIGRGGMADVYLAVDCRHGRPVALKVLRPEVGASVGAERFVREIETAARLQHPSILPVYDSGEAGEALFFVMPYVEGDTLRRRLQREKTLPWPEALVVVREVADALAYAHGRNVVHRDLKPENILFFAGHAVLADFGIARPIVRDAEDSITGIGLGVGTPEYMSPEQAFGEAVIDARSDVYGLACVIYEMLAGHPPFRGEGGFSIMLKKTRDDPPPLDAPPDAGVPPHVEPVLRRALAPQAADRYASIAEFAMELSDPRAGGRVPAARPAARELPSIAVLPFVNLSGDVANEYLSDGISDELIHALAQVDGLRVVARTSSFLFKGRVGDVRTIGEEFQVQSVLEGSVRRAANRIRITAQLIDTRTGFERWSARYDRELVDVFEVQDSIARAIVESLRGELLPAGTPVVVASTGNIEAYELFLEGRFSWNQRTAPTLRRSIECLRRAVALDPGFAQAHAALAETCVTLGIYGAAAPTVVMPQARDAAERALRLQPELPEALAARACVHALHDWDPAAAERDFRAAMTGSRASSTIFQWFATNLLVPQRRFGEARLHLARARELDPVSPVVAVSEGTTHYYERDHARAVQSYLALLDRQPEFGMAHYFLGLARAQLGEHEAAEAALARASTLLNDSDEVLAARAVLAALVGRVQDAHARLADLGARATTRYVSPVLAAGVLAQLDERDGAIALLEEALRQRSADLIWIGVRPAFDALRGDERFERITAAIGVPG